MWAWAAEVPPELGAARLREAIAAPTLWGRARVAGSGAHAENIRTQTAARDALALFETLTGHATRRALVRAGTRQPHRRTHRLQRRPRAAVRDPAAHGRPSRPGSANELRRSELASAPPTSRSHVAGRRHIDPAARRRLGRLPARGRVGAAAGGPPAPFRRSTSRSPPTCRSAPASPRPPRSRGATASALNDLLGHRSRPTALPGSAARAENEAVGAPTGDHGPDGVDALRAGLGDLPDCRSLDPAVAARHRGGRTRDPRDRHPGEHALSTGGYRERRASCEAAAGLWACRPCATSIADLPPPRSSMDDVTFRRVRHSSPRTSACSTPWAGATGCLVASAICSSRPTCRCATTSRSRPPSSTPRSRPRSPREPSARG